LPPAVRGAGAERFGLPSELRGIPGVLRSVHCAKPDAQNKAAQNKTAIVVVAQLTFI
jgi:hypothetical protein